LEYVADWQLHAGGVVLDDHVWLNYQHVINEMPMLGLNTKASVSKRVKKLVGLDLLSIIHDQDGRCFARVTRRYAEVSRMRPDGKTVASNIEAKSRVGTAKQPVNEGERPLTTVNTPLTTVNTPLTTVNTPLTTVNTPVNHGLHSINNQGINNQDYLLRQQRARDGDSNDSEKPNSSPSSEKKSGKHKATIADNWQPSDRCLELIDKAGIDRAFAGSLVDEFVLYWQERSEKRAGWDATFLNHAKAQHEKQKSRNDLGGNGSGLPSTKNKGGSNYDRKPRISEAEWWSTDF
jgi:hypothetical protein